MAKPERIRAARGTATAQQQRAGAPAVAPDAPARDLDNPVVQAGILEPTPTEVTIGGEPVLLHPLSAKHARRFIELMYLVFVRMRISPGMPAGAVSRMISATLFEDEELAFKFAGYVARAQFPPNLVPSIDLIVEQRRIDDVIASGELPAVFDAMAVLNHVMETVTAKKV